MSRYMQYYIPLNKSTLVFFPPSSHSHSSSHRSSVSENGNGYVVQVMIKTTREKPTTKEIMMAFVFQYDITKAVESIIFAHIFTTLPTEIRVEGKGYVLHGKRKEWAYGKSLQLKWGEICVRPCEDKDPFSACCLVVMGPFIFLFVCPFSLFQPRQMKSCEARTVQDSCLAHRLHSRAG